MMIENLNMYNILYTKHMYADMPIVCIEQKGERQPLLRAELKLVSFLHRVTKNLSSQFLGIWKSSFFSQFNSAKSKQNKLISFKKIIALLATQRVLSLSYSPLLCGWVWDHCDSTHVVSSYFQFHLTYRSKLTEIFILLEDFIQIPIAFGYLNN